MNAFLLLAPCVCLSVIGYGVAHAPWWLRLALAGVVVWFAWLWRVEEVRRPCLICGEGDRE